MSTTGLVPDTVTIGSIRQEVYRMPPMRSAPTLPCTARIAPEHGADHRARRTLLSNASRAGTPLLTCRPGRHREGRSVDWESGNGDVVFVPRFRSPDR